MSAALACTTNKVCCHSLCRKHIMYCQSNHAAECCNKNHVHVLMIGCLLDGTLHAYHSELDMACMSRPDGPILCLAWTVSHANIDVTCNVRYLHLEWCLCYIERDTAHSSSQFSLNMCQRGSTGPARYSLEPSAVSNQLGPVLF